MTAADLPRPRAPNLVVLATFGIVLAALAYATTPIFARMAYEAGSDPLTVITARYLIGAPVALMLLHRYGGRPKLDRRNLLWAFAIGALFVQQSYCYLGSVRYLPVGVAAVVLYVFPLLVAVFAFAIDRAPLGWPKIAGLAVAFLGVVLATAVDTEGIDARGVGLALAAAVGLSLTMVPGNRFVRRVGGIGYTALSFSAAAILSPILLLSTGAPAFPQTALGWVGLAGTALAFLAAILIIYSAMRILDPVRIGLILNVEPLLTALLGFLLLGEAVTNIQLVGAALVLGAVTAVSLHAARRA